jgi:hypothetical protein
VVPTLAGAPFSVTVSSNKTGIYNFGIAGQGTDKSAILHVFPVSFTSTSNSGSGFEFSIVNTSGAESISAGQTATYKLQVAPVNARVFPRAETFVLSLSCPPLAMCTFKPSAVPVGSGSVQLQLTISTTRAALSSGTLKRLGLLYAFCLGCPGLILAAEPRRLRPSRVQSISALLLLALVSISVILACGGGLQGGSTAVAQPGTPSGTYNMTVSATPDTPVQAASVMLTVN